MRTGLARFGKARDLNSNKFFGDAAEGDTHEEGTVSCSLSPLEGELLQTLTGQRQLFFLLNY